MEKLLAVLVFLGIILWNLFLWCNVLTILSFSCKTWSNNIIIIISSGKNTYRHVQEFVEDIILVTDDEIKRLEADFCNTGTLKIICFPIVLLIFARVTVKFDSPGLALIVNNIFPGLCKNNINLCAVYP